MRYEINLSDEFYEELIIEASVAAADNVTVTMSHLYTAPSLIRLETRCDDESYAFSSRNHFNYPIFTLWISEMIGEDLTRIFEREISETYFKILRDLSR